MKVLVTGGAGFLGRHVVEALTTAGHESVVLDDLSTGRRENLAPGVAFVESDVRNAHAMTATMEDIRPQCVVHLAARAFDVRRQFAKPADVDVNVLGALHVANAAKEAGVPHFVFASSAAVYGELEGASASEEHTSNPRSPNGVAKLAVEGFLRSASSDQGLTVSILRLANLYGPGSANGSASAVHAFVERAMSGEPPVVDGDGRQTRDFVFVRDAALAVLAIVERRSAGVFNIGTGVETSIRELASLVLAECGVDSMDPMHGPLRPNDLQRSCLDSTRLLDETGFRPTTSLSDGLTATIGPRRATILHV